MWKSKLLCCKMMFQLQRYLPRPQNYFPKILNQVSPTGPKCRLSQNACQSAVPEPPVQSTRLMLRLAHKSLLYGTGRCSLSTRHFVPRLRENTSLFMYHNSFHPSFFRMSGVVWGRDSSPDPSFNVRPSASSCDQCFCQCRSPVRGQVSRSSRPVHAVSVHACSFLVTSLSRSSSLGKPSSSERSKLVPIKLQAWWPRPSAGLASPNQVFGGSAFARFEIAVKMAVLGDFD